LPSRSFSGKQEARQGKIMVLAASPTPMELVSMAKSSILTAMVSKVQTMNAA